MSCPFSAHFRATNSAKTHGMGRLSPNASPILDKSARQGLERENALAAPRTHGESSHPRVRKISNQEQAIQSRKISNISVNSQGSDDWDSSHKKLDLNGLIEGVGTLILPAVSDISICSV